MNTVIYADILIVINLIVNYLLLRATSVILGAEHKSFRFLLSAFAGGLFSLIIFVENIPLWVNIAVKFLFISIMILIAYKIRKIGEFLKYFAAFFLCNFAFAGIMLTINILFSSNAVIFKNGIVYFDIGIFTLIVSSLCCYIALSVISRFTKNRMVNNLIYEISMYYEGKYVSSKALLDTGNTLKDGFSGKPVIIAEKHAAEKLIPDNSDITQLKNFRLIPYSTINSGGALPAFLLDKVIVFKGGKEIVLKNVYLAVAEKKIISSDYSALLGTSFFEAINNYDYTKGERKNERNTIGI